MERRIKGRLLTSGRLFSFSFLLVKNKPAVCFCRTLSSRKSGKKEEAWICEWQVLRDGSHHRAFMLIFNERSDRGGCQNRFCGHLLPPTAKHAGGQSGVAGESVGGVSQFE